MNRRSTAAKDVHEGGIEGKVAVVETTQKMNKFKEYLNNSKKCAHYTNTNENPTESQQKPSSE